MSAMTMVVSYRIYLISLAFIHVVYALVFLGILSSVPNYVYYLNISVQILLCLFLMLRYHPFRTHNKLGPFDAKLIFGASSLLLFNIVSLPVLYSYVGAVEQGIHRYL